MRRIVTCPVVTQVRDLESLFQHRALWLPRAPRSHGQAMDRMWPDALGRTTATGNEGCGDTVALSNNALPAVAIQQPFAFVVDGEWYLWVRRRLEPPPVMWIRHRAVALGVQMRCSSRFAADAVGERVMRGPGVVMRWRRTSATRARSAPGPVLELEESDSDCRDRSATLGFVSTGSRIH